MTDLSGNLLEPGFHVLEVGDNVEESIGSMKGKWGSVVGLDGGYLVVLWPDRTWELVEDFYVSTRVLDAPYQIQRREWDLIDTEAIHDAVVVVEFEPLPPAGPHPDFVGTDLEPNA